MDEIVKSPHDIFVKEVLGKKENARDFFSITCLPKKKYK